MFNNYTNLEFNKINILKQGFLTPSKIKKLRLSNISVEFYRLLQICLNLFKLAIKNCIIRVLVNIATAFEFNFKSVLL